MILWLHVREHTLKRNMKTFCSFEAEDRADCTMVEGAPSKTWGFLFDTRRHECVLFSRGEYSAMDWKEAWITKRALAYRYHAAEPSSLATTSISVVWY